MTNKGGKKSTTKGNDSRCVQFVRRKGGPPPAPPEVSLLKGVLWGVSLLIKRSGLRALAPEMEQVNAIILEKLQLS